ncbi:MAG: glycosyltransferase [Myxococcota bacterium]|nr:glycosyltransferase [Myxococcota bacterium]
MDILLLSDSRYKRELSKEHRVLCMGPLGINRMQHQNDFDVVLPQAMSFDFQDGLSQLRKICPGFNPAIVVQFETELNYFYRGIENSKAITVWRSVDNHLFGHWQRFYGQIFDLVLVAQKDYIPDFHASGCHAVWFPLCVDRDLHYDRNQERDLNVSFVGNMNPKLQKDRIDFFETLSKTFPVSIFQGKSQSEIAEIYNRSKIVINECLNLDLNYRVFEAMANGAVCLTPQIDGGIADLFTEEEDFVFYKGHDPKDAAQHIQRILADLGYQKRVARSGREKTLSHHTLANRATELLALANRIIPGQKRLSGSVRDQFSILSILAEFHFGISRDDKHHLTDLCAHLLKRHPADFSKQLISISLDWFERGNTNAARFFLQQSMRGETPPLPFLKLRRMLSLQLKRSTP